MADVTPSGRPSGFGEVVRDTRAGDQFHYVWAATEALGLLDPRSGLREVWIESAPGVAGEGDEIIDVMHRYGSSASRFDRVVVTQLKYSTRRRTTPLGLSELGEAFQKFARLEQRAEEAFAVPAEVAAEYVLLSNRPFEDRLRNALEQVRGCVVRSVTAKALLRRLGLPLEQAAELCSRIRLESEPWVVQTLRAAADEQTSALAGGFDPGVAALLIGAVAERAAGLQTGPLRAVDVAGFFGVQLQQLQPAPSQLPLAPAEVQRTSWPDLADEVLRSKVPVVVTAIGGMGKSTFAAALPSLVADRADVVVYDCFGGGSYRSVDAGRHRAAVGLVQIVSELAARGWCGPLIPRLGQDAATYFSVFRQRLMEAVAAIGARAPGRQLLLVVDAADNAAVAGDERAERPFVRDLLSMTAVPGVQVVVTARPERVPLLQATGVTLLPLAPFTVEETAVLLRSRFESVSQADAEELHALTSGNPRVQAVSLEGAPDLMSVLARLAGVSASGPDPLERLLADRLDAALLHASAADRGRLEFLARLLVVLRPPIAVGLLAGLVECDPGLVRSFVADFGAGLIATEAGVRFADEPTETFFRSRFALEGSAADEVVAALRRLAARSGYAATVLPQVLWVTGRHQELMELARSDEALPDGEVERRQVALLRSEFALRAGIVLGDPAAIVRLSIGAGSAAAAAERRYTLLRDEPDLAGMLISSATLDDLHAAGAWPTDWPGASLSAEAAMLAMQPDRVGETRSRVRAAEAAMKARLTRPKQTGGDRPGSVTPQQVAAIAFALHRLDGPEKAGQYLAMWRPQGWVVTCASAFAERLLDRGEVEAVQQMAGATASTAVGVAVAAALLRAGRGAPHGRVEHLWALLQQEQLEVDRAGFSRYDESDVVDRGVTWICAAAARYEVASRAVVSAMVTDYLPVRPPSSLGDRGRTDSGLLLLYGLRARLAGETLSVEELVPEESDIARRPARERAQSRLTPLLPWVTGWARLAVGELPNGEALELLRTFPQQRREWQDENVLRRLAGPIVMQVAASSSDAAVLEAGREILSSAPAHSGLWGVAAMITTLHGDERFAEEVFAAASAAKESALAVEWTADQSTEGLIRLARAVWVFNADEGLEYAQLAITVASRVGDDAYPRWQALLGTARAARRPTDQDGVRLALRLGRIAEHVAPRLNDEIDEPQLVPALAGLAGPVVLAQAAQWRSRLFGSTAWQLDLAVAALGLGDTIPLAAAALAACSDRIAVPPLLARLRAEGAASQERVAALQELQWARGGGALTDEGESGRDASIEAGDPDLEFRTRVAAGRDRITAALRDVEVWHAAGMAEAVRVLQAEEHWFDVRPLVERIAALPVHRRAAAVRLFDREESIGASDRVTFVLAGGEVAGSSLAARRAIQDLAAGFVERYATEVVSGYGYGFDVDRFAAVMQVLPREVLLLALRSTDAAVAVSSAQRCFRLTAVAAAMTAPEEAAEALSRALAEFEDDLGVEPFTAEAVNAPDAADVNAMVAGYLWAMLADPVAATRWRAMHAVRLLLAARAEDVVAALARVAAEEGPPVGFIDRRFPFYVMHAAESLLVAVERVALTDSPAVLPLAETVRLLASRNRDHWRIQTAWRRIQQRCSRQPEWPAEEHLPAGPDASVEAPVRAVPMHERPDDHAPWEGGSSESEFDFGYDLQRYWFGDLTRCFDVPQAEVLHQASEIVLTEWGWRHDPALAIDPRQAANVFGEQTTWPNHFSWPAADDLHFYLSYHALMTIAGRLESTATQWRDPDDPLPDFERWGQHFDLARDDGYWAADARRPVAPAGHGNSESSTWRSDVQAADFVRILLPAPGVVTVAQSAEDIQLGKHDRVSVHSWLVDRRTGPALVRAMQTGPSLGAGFIMPGEEPDDPAVEVGQFRAYAWVGTDYGEGGQDRRDELATDLQCPLPTVDDRVRSRLGLQSDGVGTCWTIEGDPSAKLEVSTWSGKQRSGRDPNGPSGYRAVATQRLVDRAVETGDLALMVEVRIARHAYSSGSFGRDRDRDDDRGPADDYLRFFLYAPESGWRDYRGDPVAG